MTNAKKIEPDRHYLESELHEAFQSDPEIFRFLDEAGLDGMWFWDLERPENEWLSPKFKSVLGYEDHEVPNESSWWQAHIFPDDLELAVENFQAHESDPSKPYDQVVRYRHRDGRVITVRCRGIIIRDGAGKPKRMLGTHTDLTELKETEETLRKSNSLLQTFAATVSHDLKAPLRHAKIFVRRASVAARSGDTENLERALERVEQASDRALGVIEGLLRLSEAQRYTPPADAQADLACCLREAIDAIYPAPVQIESEKLPTVRGDSDLWTSAFANLLTNASKYNQNDFARVRIRAVNEYSTFSIEVHDDGLGIPYAEREMIFEPFGRGSAASKGVQGHGLGLAFCRAVVEAHGGSIQATQSDLGGACIKMHLPTASVLKSV